MKVRFYGRLGETLGEEVDVDLPRSVDTIVALRAMLAGMFPHASGDLCGRSRACIADAFVLDDHKLTGVGAVEFLPPLSGG